MKRLKMIYVAGKFSGKTRADVEANIAYAVHAGVAIAKLGGMPMIPHANTAHPAFEEVQPYQFWIQGTMQQLEACNAVFLVPGWTQSSGARGEKARAEELGMPVFENLVELKDWLDSSTD